MVWFFSSVHLIFSILLNITSSHSRKHPIHFNLILIYINTAILNNISIVKLSVDRFFLLLIFLCSYAAFFVLFLSMCIHFIWSYAPQQDETRSSGSVCLISLYIVVNGYSAILFGAMTKLNRAKANWKHLSIWCYIDFN